VSRPDSTAGGVGTFSFTVVADTVVAPTVPVETPAPTAPGAPVAPTTTGDVAGATGDDADDRDSTSGPLGLSRLLATLGLGVLFGSLVLIAIAWPEGVEYVLTVRFLRTAWGVAVLGAVLNVITLTASTTGRAIGSSVLPTEWSDLTDTGPGIAALVRVALTVGAAWVIARPERVIDPATQLAALAVPGIAVATFGFSRSGGDAVVLGAAAGVVHALAMAVWLGGLVLVARVVLAGPGEDDLVHAVRGFSRVSGPAIALTVATGAIQTWRLDRGGLFDTSHGYVLLVKAVAVGAMVFVGLVARQFIRDRLARASSITGPLASRLRRALGVEAIAGVLVLVLTAWMLSLTPVRADQPSTGPDVQPAQVVANETAEVRVALTQVVGLNAVVVDVIRPESGIPGVTIELTPPVATGVAGVILDVPLTGAGRAVLERSEGLPLQAAGTWTLSVRIGDAPIGSRNVQVSATG